MPNTLSSAVQGYIEELPFGPAGPPLGWTSIRRKRRIKNLLRKSCPSLVPQLETVKLYSCFKLEN